MLVRVSHILYAYGEILKRMPEVAKVKLIGIFNGILNGDLIPNEWKECSIYTIHKGGDISYCSNYRPIAPLDPV